MTIGRRGDVLLQDDSVSRNHAVLEKRAEGWLLCDLGSRNGTTVNGISVVRQLLASGDVVGFGKVRLTVEAVEADAPTADEPSASPRRADEDGATMVWDGPTMTWGMMSGERGAIGVLRHLAEGAYMTPFDAFRRIAEDISGIRGVSRVRLTVDRRPLGCDEDVVCTVGGERGRYVPEVDAELCAHARKSGEASARAKGRLVPVGEGADLVAFPLHIRGTVPVGAVLVEAVSEFDGGGLADLRAEVAGLEIAIGIWSGIASVGSGLKALPAKSGATPVMVGRSEALQNAVRLATRAARSEATILLFGESGTGKELFARLVYDESARRTKQFVAVHSSAIEQTLLGSTLFGHEKGAFTGADRQKKGLFEEADGGTIFLDEIGELSQDMQVKLLRVLQEGEFMRVGGTETIHVDVRVICATNRNLAEAVKEGKFREDLFYRLNVIQIDLPPLRERSGDVVDLINHFVTTLGGKSRSVSAEAMSALAAYRWPGNIRQLRNCVERTLVLSPNDELQLSDFPQEIQAAAGGGESAVSPNDSTGTPDSTGTTGAADATSGTSGTTEQTASSSTLAAHEADYIRSVLAACGGNKKLAAERLGISRSTLYEKLAACPNAGHDCSASCPTGGHESPSNT